MKKLILILLLLALSVLPASAAQIRVYQSDNPLGKYAYHDIPTTVLRAKYTKILGVAIVPYDMSKNTEFVASLWDTVNNDEGGTVFEMIAEPEVDINGSNVDWYIYPLTVNEEIHLRQGPNTTVLIYYRR